MTARDDALRALAREVRGLVSRYTRAMGENDARVANLLSEDTYRIGTQLLAILDATEAHRTIRLEMFEVYEPGEDFPLYVTSDGAHARRNAKEGDRIVRRHWVREGESE